MFLSICRVVSDHLLVFQFCFLKIMKFGCHTLRITSQELKNMDHTFGNQLLKVLIDVQRWRHLLTHLMIMLIFVRDWKIWQLKEKDQNEGDLRANRDLRFSLSLDTIRLVSSFDTSHEILERLKELYSGNVDQTHYVQTTLLSG